MVVLDSNMANWTIFKPNSPFLYLPSVVVFNVRMCVAVPARKASLLYGIFCTFIYILYFPPAQYASYLFLCQHSGFVIKGAQTKMKVFALCSCS